MAHIGWAKSCTFGSNTYTVNSYTVKDGSGNIVKFGCGNDRIQTAFTGGFDESQITITTCDIDKVLATTKGSIGVVTLVVEAASAIGDASTATYTYKMTNGIVSSIGDVTHGNEDNKPATCDITFDFCKNGATTPSCGWTAA